MEVKIDPRKCGVGKTVLVVDDSPFVRKALENAFLSDGFKTCVEAENGKEGIEAAKTCQPDLIILDLSMPVMNGLEAAPILRELFPKVPIFLFSLYADVLSQQVASRAGVNFVISKNEPVSKLVDKAHEIMGMSQSQREIAVHQVAQVVIGDVTHPGTLAGAVDGIDAVVFTLRSDGGGNGRVGFRPVTVGRVEIRVTYSAGLGFHQVFGLFQERAPTPANWHSKRIIQARREQQR